MADNSKIEWTDQTDNIIVVKGGGHWCRKKSDGCANCYAEQLNNNSFFGGNHLPYKGQPPVLELRRDIIEKWARQRKPKKHFVASMTDVFGEWVKRAWQFEFLDGMLAAPLQTFQVLSKRANVLLKTVRLWMAARGITRPPANIWLGFTAENQKEFDRRWQDMKPLAVMGWTIFVSCEPLLGPIILPEDFLELGNRAQVIVGGESGKNARPMHPDWTRQLRSQCVAAGVPFFFKQWGEWAPIKPALKDSWEKAGRPPVNNFIKADKWGVLMPDGRFFLGGKGMQMRDLLHPECQQHMLYRVGKKVAGRLLDGRAWDEFPVNGGQSL